jgi:thioester reductase-like protein
MQVLTGATGSLGAHVLHQLVLSSNVRKVICLSRASSHEESKDRVRESLKLRKLPLLADDKFDSYAANPNLPLLGLSREEYDIIRNEVTDVIHVSNSLLLHSLIPSTSIRTLGLLTSI